MANSRIERVKERNAAYYRKFPQDIKRVREILKYLSLNKVILPNGGHLTPRRFLQLGLNFGGTGKFLSPSWGVNGNSSMTNVLLLQAVWTVYMVL